MQLKNGKFGPFLGCRAYPRCQHTQNIKQSVPPIAWVNASAIGSAHYCPNSLYLRKRQFKQSAKALKKMAYGRRSHRLAARDTRCYLATFAFHEQHPYVIHLRQWRDSVLLKRFYGKFIVQCYYQLSPWTIYFFGHSIFFRTITQKLVSCWVKHTLKSEVK